MPGNKDKTPVGLNGKKTDAFYINKITNNYYHVRDKNGQLRLAQSEDRTPTAQQSVRNKS